METPETYMECFISVVEEIPLEHHILKMVKDFVRENQILLPENSQFCEIKTHFSQEVFGIKVTVCFLAIKKKNEILQPI